VTRRVVPPSLSPAAPAAQFTTRTLAFLRALERNNRREWFHARKDRYEADVRAPMVALVEHLAVAFAAFAPDLAASPRASMYRPYRDTRFSPNKTPLKTHVAAVFPHKLLPKHEGAGFYVEVAPHHVWFGGGMYMPSGPVLYQVREHIAREHRRLARILSAPAFKRTFGTLDGAQLQRVPRGFAPDHPAAALLKFKQFIAGCERPAEFAVEPGFDRALVAAFRTLAPLVEFLNEPLVAGLQSGALGRTWTDAPEL
jgi:uncharacterized protein (TIGR02453 family)